ncbi:DNA translocase FtsK [Streptomyces sp. MBT84]|uniref:FtsK/SpoIIIE domain-containing protein n=1 Tax=Streptomyces sp. MBT84 TaxID=1488414 RepID=UPI001D29F5B9|nr:FtsK/SpoIIIE domain-containing protein [Streptomyces sp. MBT84]MBW8702289.1 DNA translocase FtsK [Streptomyces sp. MBT84]
MNELNEAFGWLRRAMWLGIGLIALWAVVWVVRYLRASPMERISIRQAIRIRWGWKRLAQMCRLSVTDKMPTPLASLANTDGTPPKPRVLVPALKVTPDAFGVMAWANCLPKVGLAEFQKAAPYLADAWRMTRVSALPGDRPGQVLLRGVRVDPLIVPTVHVPTGRPPEEYAKWDLGVDEFGMPVVVPLREVPGMAVGGLPGFGKTSCVNRLVCDWAPSPAVQFVFFDGKVSHAYEGDYSDLAQRAFAFCGDDLEQANKLLKELVQLRRARSASIRSVLGVKNMWHVGPSADWPLIVVVIDEAHTYFRDHKGSDPATRKLAAFAADNARLTEDLVKKGRSVGFLTVLTTQKTTGDAIPTFIRDVCPVGLSFAQKTADAAVAALGDDIREWPDASPVNLQDPAYVGVAVMSQHGRPGFVRIRTPYVADEDAARIAEQTAHLTQHPARLLENLTGRPVVDLTKPDPEPPAKAA